MLEGCTRWFVRFLSTLNQGADTLEKGIPFSKKKGDRPVDKYGTRLAIAEPGFVPRSARLTGHPFTRRGMLTRISCLPRPAFYGDIDHCEPAAFAVTIVLVNL